MVTSNFIKERLNNLFSHMQRCTETIQNCKNIISESKKLLKNLEEEYKIWSNIERSI